MDGEDRELLRSVDNRVGRIELALLGDEYTEGSIDHQAVTNDRLETLGRVNAADIACNRRSIAWVKGIGLGAGFVLGLAIGGLEYLRRM